MQFPKVQVWFICIIASNILQIARALLWSGQVAFGRKVFLAEAIGFQRLINLQNIQSHGESLLSKLMKAGCFI